MTSNQISYWANQEKARATDETIRSNKVKEGLEAEKIAETQRHNLADEDIRNFEAYLKERGVNQKDRELLLKNLENEGKYGIEYSENAKEGVAGDLAKIYREAWNMIFGNKGIGSLGSFF